MGVPQNVHAVAYKFAGSVCSPPQFVHFTCSCWCVSSVDSSCANHSSRLNPWTVSSLSGMSLTAAQYGHFSVLLPGANESLAPQDVQGNARTLEEVIWSRVVCEALGFSMFTVRGMGVI